MSYISQFIVSHPTGNTFVRALIEELDKMKKLEKFFTTIGSGKDANDIFKIFMERRSYSVSDQKIKRLWFPEIKRFFFQKNQTQEKKRQQIDKSYTSLDQNVALNLQYYNAFVIHSYEDAAACSFKRAKELGMACSYELPIAYWMNVRKLLAEEAERFPEWEPTLESTFESEEKLTRKEEEINLADYISCPSQFVLESIPKEIRQKKPCQIVPFGSPTSPKISLQKTPRIEKSLKVLFVGSMSQRKGLADLFEAMKILSQEPVSLSILGQPSMPMEFYRKAYSGFQYFAPCSNEKVRQIMLQHDVLALPSIVEGRALVQQEALSCGLPIIVTPNAGGQDLVEEGVTGYLIPPRSPTILAEKILQLVENIDSLHHQEIACREKAIAFSWSNYARKIINFSFYNSGKSH